MEQQTRFSTIPVWVFIVSLLGIAAPAQAEVAIDWVTVGDPGNECSIQTAGCFGSVDDVYRIGTYEVTNAQYAEFLNAVATDDTNGLYHPNMGMLDPPIFTGGITRVGGPGSYTYSAFADREEHPVNYVSFWDATRFANWLHNGQPTGAQDSTTTEDGAYTLTPTGIATNTVTRNEGAEVFVPSEDEWFKAAYYTYPVAPFPTLAESYNDYPAGSDTQTTCAVPSATANTANCDPSVGDLTDVGSYTGAASPSGTFDQGGNVWEWNETITDYTTDPNRGTRGGSYISLSTSLENTNGNWNALDVHFNNLGFRVASPVSSEPPPPEASVVASSLPSSRSVQVGNLASVFATVINGSATAAIDCSLTPQTSVAADFAYWTTDAANVPTGSPNTPASIPGNGSQNFIFGFAPTAPISPTEVLMTYDCANTDPAPVTVGVNTLLLSAEATPVPDIVALAATATADGIVDIPGSNGSNAFAVSTVNVGSTATITASARTSVTLPLVMSICETNPGTGVCLSAPAASATSSVSAGATPTYSVFVTGTGTVPFDPANNRIVVEFKDAGAVVRGATSVAVRTQ